MSSRAAGSRWLRDGLLLMAALGVVAGFLWTVVRQVRATQSEGLTTGDSLIAFAVFAVYATGSAWIALGCWRRTSWSRRR